MLKHNAESLGYLTGRIYGLLRRRIQTRLDEAGIGLSMDLYPILNNLWRKDQITQQNLTDILDFDRHRVSRMLDVIEEKGWIERRPHPSSRREKLLVVTPAGKKQEGPVMQCIHQSLDEAVEGLSPSRKKALFRDLQKILTNLS